MPPKKKKGGGDGGSKKSVQKKKEKLIEDKTFGLKNKNKSKKVQAHIQSVRKNVENSGDPKMKKLEEQRKRAKAELKARKKAAEEERNALFGEALMAVKKKTSTKMKAETEAKGRDHEDGKAEKGGTSRAMKMMFQMDAQEMEDALTKDPNYVRTIEDDVEQQRQQKLAELKKKGIKGTPVTEESFKAWQDRKRKAKQDKARKLVEAEMKKKKGGKGLSVLSGRDLFEYKRDLFKDDEMVVDANNLGTNTDEHEHEHELEHSPQVQTESTSDTNASSNAKQPSLVDEVTDQVQSDLFLEGDDDDLDDLDDLDDD